MQKRIRLTDCLTAAGVSACFALAYSLSDWTAGTTTIVATVFLMVAIVSVVLNRRRALRVEKSWLDRTTTAEQRCSLLEASYADIEDELKSLRVEFDTTEKVKESFLANISHEIRTPMNGIFGMTELLGQTQLSTKQQRYADTIRRSTESLLNIVNDILDFSKIQNGELSLECTAFQLADLLEDVCDLYAEAAQKGGVEIICDVSAINNMLIHGDPIRVRQIVNNLVSNAIKFTEHGEILVSAMPTSKEDEYIISVADTGIGIASDIQEHIFREFTQGDSTTTRKFGGTGLGLSIANKLVALMDGELTFTSKVGTGSTFSFTCHLQNLPDNHSLPQRIDNVRALVVDDNHTNSSILVHQLEQWGINATSTDSGSEALELLKKSLNDEPFDIAILDLHMPHMDGLELASQIHSNVAFASLRLMMLTSSLTNLTTDELQGLGISCALTKPARQASLYNAITGMINKPTEQFVSDIDKPPLPETNPIKPKILLTEDNPINQEVAAIMLESIGCEVEIAENGSEAVNALASTDFDLVFMDCQMPVMDGFEATRTIRSESRQHDIPVVALTANAMEGDRELCIASGMDDYLSKPVNQSELQQAIEKWIHQKPKLAEYTNMSQTTSKEVLETMSFEFDESALDAIKALQRPGKPDILGRIVTMYLDKTPELIADIENGIAANDAARVKMAAHTLKSSSAYLGATTLADKCNKLEAKAANDDLTDGAEDVSVISQGFAAISEKIKRFA